MRVRMGVSALAVGSPDPIVVPTLFSRTLPVEFVGDYGEVGVAISRWIFCGILAGDLQDFSPRRHLKTAGRPA